MFSKPPKLELTKVQEHLTQQQNLTHQVWFFTSESFQMLPISHFGPSFFFPAELLQCCTHEVTCWQKLGLSIEMITGMAAFRLQLSTIDSKGFGAVNN